MKLNEFIGLLKLENKSNHWLNSCVTVWLRKFADSVDVNNVEQVTQYLNNLQGNLQVASYKKRFYQIRRFLAEAFDLHYLDKIRMPRLPVRLPHIVEEKDIKNILKQIRTSKYKVRLEALILLLSSSGMRPSEAFRLTTDDIDLDNRTIVLRQTKTNIERVVFFDSKAEKAIRRHIALNKNRILFNQTRCTRELHKFGFQVKLCRKFFSQEWVRRNGNQAVKEILMGHSLNGNVDMSHYCTLSIEDLREVYRKVME